MQQNKTLVHSLQPDLNQHVTSSNPSTHDSDVDTSAIKALSTTTIVTLKTIWRSLMAPRIVIRARYALPNQACSDSITLRVDAVLIIN